jgi:polar amino acid transport system substrate-binding protein
MRCAVPRPAHCVAVLVLLALLGTDAIAAACDKTLSISSSDYPPYVYRDKGGDWTGLDVQLMQAIFKEADCHYTFAPLVAPKHMVERVSIGKTDVLLAASDSPERRKANRFGVAYRQESVGFFALSKQFSAYRGITSFQALLAHSAPLLLPNAGYYGDDYAQALPALRSNGRVVEFTYFDQGIRMLAAGRATFIMSDMAALTHAARQLGVAIDALPFTINSAPVHMMFSKLSVSQHDIDLLNAATVRLEQRGRLQAIRHAYGTR